MQTNIQWLSSLTWRPRAKKKKKKIFLSQYYQYWFQKEKLKYVSIKPLNYKHRIYYFKCVSNFSTIEHCEVSQTMVILVSHELFGFLIQQLCFFFNFILTALLSLVKDTSNYCCHFQTRWWKPYIDFLHGFVLPICNRWNEAKIKNKICTQFDLCGDIF